jgi:hypothetical protein
MALAPLIGGGMVLEIGNPAANPAATAKHGVLLARITACHTPAKTNLSAVAEGIVDGNRQTIPLKVDALPETGTWSIARAWPTQGKWVVRLVATHPEYGTYASSLVVSVEGNTFDWGKVKRFAGNPPTPADIAKILAE